MILRDFLDEVRFGNVSRLCVAIIGEDGFLDNYEAGRYWELTCGNWADGSRSEAEPEIPAEIMNAQVAEVDASPNLRGIYAELGRLGTKSRDTTVILVRKPAAFNANKYWKDNDTWEPAVSMDMNMHEWAYNISIEKWEEIQKLENHWPTLNNAIYRLFDFGVDNIRNLTDEDLEGVDADVAQSYRLAQSIVNKLSSDKEILALFELAGMGSAFKKRL